MGAVGWLYVLANSSMPGLVKVGKTTRKPGDRSSELSSVTGVPTPFIVVYEQLFESCDDAELFVHTFLERKGFRVASNREFFNAPINDVIRAIAEAPGSLDNDGYLTTTERESTIAYPAHPEYALSDRGMDDDSGAAPKSQPWQAVFDEAEKYYFGFGDYIQDYSEAFKLFRQAADLGAVMAYRHLGDLSKNEQGVFVNNGRALEYYKEGARKGSVICYWKLGELFLGDYRAEAPNFENSAKCFSIFVTRLSDPQENDQLPDRNEWRCVISGCTLMIYQMLLLGQRYPPIIDEVISLHIADVAKEVQGIKLRVSPSDLGALASWDRVLKHLERDVT